MKNLLCTVMFAIPFLSVTAQDFPSRNIDHVFTVSGDAIIRVQPDQVVLHLGVETRGKDLVATKTKNDSIIKDAIAFCRNQGIPEKHLQTDYIRINPRYDNYEDVEIDYYSVTQSIAVVLEDVPKYEQIITELLARGINQINSVDFRTTELRKHKDEARKLAIQAAKEKAALLASETGIVLDKIINVSESWYNYLPGRAFSASNYANISQNVVQESAMPEGEEALSLGMISIKAEVTLTYALKTD